MKKAEKLGFFLMSIALLLIVNCKDLKDESTIIGDGLKLPKTLTVVATGSVDSVVFPVLKSGRQIVPASLNGSNLYFYLWGDDKLEVSKSVSPRKIDFYASSGTNGRTGTIELMDLEESQYELFLVATQSEISLGGTDEQNIDSIKDQAVLSANAIVDMRYNQRVSFYLTPYALDGSGNVSLTVYYYVTNPDGTTVPLVAPYTNNGGVTFGIYNIDDGSEIEGRFTPALAPQSTKVSLNPTEIQNMNCVKPAAPNYVWYGIDAGTYNFTVTFNDTVHDKQYVYSDTIIILTNQTTEATVVIGDIIGKYPNQPVEFTAKYSDSDTNGSGYYDVEFIWDDTSNNEQYFQIDLMDIDGLKTSYEADVDIVTAADGCRLESLVNGTLAIVPASKALNIAAENAWNRIQNYLGASKVTSLTYEVKGSPEYWVSGSLHSGSEYVVIKLPLGSRYLARLCAVNAAGESGYSYCGIGREDVNDPLATPPVTDAIMPVPYTKNGVGATFIPQKFPENSRCINRFVIKYNFSSDAGGRGEATYYYTQYDGTGKITKITPTKANQKNVPTLAADLHSDIRYYTQITGGNEILNPLKVANQNIINNVAYPFYSLARAGQSWTAWKLDSEFGTTLYEPRVSVTPAPEQVLSDTTQGQLLGYYSPYDGYKSINLFATYNAVVVEIYNPADDSILDDDILMYKTKNVYSSITSSDNDQIATINKANNIVMDYDNTLGYKKFFIAVRNEKYDKIEIDVETNHGNLRATKLSTKETLFNMPRHVLTTAAPVDWVSNFSSYYTKEGHYFEPLPAATAWAPLNFYMLEKDGSVAEKFTYFEFDAMEYGSQTIIFRVKGYSSRSPQEPFTYPITVNFVEKPTYSVTEFEPLDFATNYTKYYEFDGANYVQNTNPVWSAGNVYQEN